MGSSYEKQITNIRFNQDKSCFMCCMENGLRIYNIDPLVEKVHYDEQQIGGVAFSEMVYRCNLFAIVSGGSRPKYADNSVLVYDDARKRSVLEFTFNQQVLAVRCRRDRLVAVLKNRIHIFSFPSNSQKLFTIETRSNPLGLCELSPGRLNLLIFPGSKIGSLQLMNLDTTEATVSSSPSTINAHQGELAIIAINQTGTHVATASEKGTLIRVWDTTKRTLLNELRRGSDPATVYCINFSLDTDFLCCSSDKGTIHIFALKDSHLNRRSTFSKIGFLGDYIEKSQWALANFTVPPECACVCAFASNSTVVAICMDGTFHKYVFNSDGQCSRLSFDVFLELTDGSDFESSQEETLKSPGENSPGEEPYNSSEEDSSKSLPTAPPVSPVGYCVGDLHLSDVESDEKINEVIRKQWANIELASQGQKNVDLPPKILEECEVWHRTFPNNTKAFSMQGKMLLNGVDKYEDDEFDLDYDDDEIFPMPEQNLKVPKNSPELGVNRLMWSDSSEEDNLNGD